MLIRNAKSVNQPLKTEHGEIVFELLGSAAGGSQSHSLAQIVILPGKGSLRHYHPVAEESYYVLSGTAQMELDGETATLVPGDSVVILPDQVHRIFNTGSQNLVILAICVPAWTPDNSVYLD